LLVMAVAFTALFLAMHLKAMRNEILRRRAKSLMLAEVERSRPRAKSLPAE
jgi:heme exporter protein C